MRLFRIALSATLLVATAACASTSVTGPAATGRFDAFEAITTSDFTGYGQVYIAPVQLSEAMLARVDYRPRNSNDRIRPLTELEMKRKAEDLGEAMARAVSEVATLTDAPGEGVLTISATLTELDANRPTQAELGANPGLSIKSRYTGRAAVSINFLEGDILLATAEDGDVDSLDLREIEGSTWSSANMIFGRIASKVAALLG